MSTYYINVENTGLENEDQVAVMAEFMQFDGHDVEFTSNFGLINRIACPVSDQEWARYLEQADSQEF